MSSFTMRLKQTRSLVLRQQWCAYTDLRRGEPERLWLLEEKVYLDRDSLDYQTAYLISGHSRLTVSRLKQIRDGISHLMIQKTHYNNVLVRRTTRQLLSISIKQIKDLQAKTREVHRSRTIVITKSHQSWYGVISELVPACMIRLKQVLKPRSSCDAEPYPLK
ncbi:hypothetical protein J6590_000724 [Homalodisca vitripennis]|nr:hypothetical protein J6590_000724 [Homalodisca vitripennis]